MYLADRGVIYRRFQLNGFNRFGCHMPLDQGLQLAGNSLIVGTTVDS